jgi:hypothetical protein
LGRASKKLILGSLPLHSLGLAGETIYGSTDMITLHAAVAEVQGRPMTTLGVARKQELEGGPCALEITEHGQQKRHRVIIKPTTF